MAFLRDKYNNIMRDGQGNQKVTISEAQANAAAVYAERKAQKLIGADIRREAREARTNQQQLERLDMLLGKGLGAVKERARLERLIGAAA